MLSTMQCAYVVSAPAADKTILHRLLAHTAALLLFPLFVLRLFAAVLFSRRLLALASFGGSVFLSLHSKQRRRVNRKNMLKSKQVKKNKQSINQEMSNANENQQRNNTYSNESRKPRIVKRTCFAGAFLAGADFEGAFFAPALGLSACGDEAENSEACISGRRHRKRKLLLFLL